MARRRGRRRHRWAAHRRAGVCVGGTSWGDAVVGIVGQEQAEAAGGKRRREVRTRYRGEGGSRAHTVSCEQPSRGNARALARPRSAPGRARAPLLHFDVVLPLPDCLPLPPPASRPGPPSVIARQQRRQPVAPTAGKQWRHASSSRRPSAARVCGPPAAWNRQRRAAARAHASAAAAPPATPVASSDSLRGTWQSRMAFPLMGSHGGGEAGAGGGGCGPPRGVPQWRPRPAAAPSDTAGSRLP